jgi:hypothetical protein
MRNRELISQLLVLPPDAEVIVCSEDDSLLIPAEVRLEPTCDEGVKVIRIYVEDAGVRT